MDNLHWGKLSLGENLQNLHLFWSRLLEGRDRRKCLWRRGQIDWLVLLVEINKVPENLK